MTTKSKRGGPRPGAGRKKTVKRQVIDAIGNIDCERIFKSLDEWSKGKPVICPHCLNDTGQRTADTVALQSAVELLNRRLGKPVAKQEVDITTNIVLTADQIDTILERYQIAQRSLLPAAIDVEAVSVV